MTSFEFNKFFGAFLAILFVLFSIRIMSNLIFVSQLVKKPGYRVAASTETSMKKSLHSVSPQEESSVPLLAKANIEAGRSIARKCVACHAFEKGGANRIGPNLYAIVNRPVASGEGFSYSSGMKRFLEEKKAIWNYEKLDRFLANPKAYVKNTIMAFPGIAKASQRADLIAYLRSLSDNPAPLPKENIPAPEKMDHSPSPSSENPPKPLSSLPAD